MIERLLNRLTDLDWGWWPVLRLRPQRHESMTTARVALMSAIFCPVYGGAVLAFLIGVGWSPLGGILPTFLLVTLESMIAFFVVYRLTFAAAWNLRAERLRKAKAIEL